MNWIIPTLVIVILYTFIGFCVSKRGRWSSKCIVFSPMKIVAGSNRLASLSNFQMLLFTLAVLWLSIHWLVKSGGMIVKPEGDIAILLGIAGSGTALGKATDNIRSMLSQENFFWLKEKKWIEKDLIRGKYNGRKPRLRDMISTDGKWDISRFQALGFTLFIVVALLWQGISVEIPPNTFEFSVGQTYLTLIGASQALYVGGKFSQKDSIKQLDVKLDEVREKERAFRLAVSISKDWQEKSRSLETHPKELLNLAQVCAPDTYCEFMYVAEEASNLVNGFWTSPPREKKPIHPSLPPLGA